MLMGQKITLWNGREDLCEYASCPILMNQDTTLTFSYNRNQNHLRQNFVDGVHIARLEIVAFADNTPDGEPEEILISCVEETINI